MEFTSANDGVIEKIEVGGIGWDAVSIGLDAGKAVRQGETVLIPFQGDVKDGVGKLETRVPVDGERVEKKSDLSPQRIAAMIELAHVRTMAARRAAQSNSRW
ncbi:MAG: hypothetical protein ACKVS9_06995 [Phycisphaerae bacterium]